jgi:hypothetical protein
MCEEEDRYDFLWLCLLGFGLHIRQHVISQYVVASLDMVDYLHKQARVLTPSIFMAQLPQIPSLQLLRNVNVGSTSFFILIKASNIIGPVLFRSKV